MILYLFLFVSFFFFPAFSVPYHPFPLNQTFWHQQELQKLKRVECLFAENQQACGQDIGYFCFWVIFQWEKSSDGDVIDCVLVTEYNFSINSIPRMKSLEENLGMNGEKLYNLAFGMLLSPVTII